MEDNLNNITYFTVLNIIQMLHNSKSNYVVEWDKDLKIPRTVEILIQIKENREKKKNPCYAYFFTCFQLTCPK